MIGYCVQSRHSTMVLFVAALLLGFVPYMSGLFVLCVCVCVWPKKQPCHDSPRVHSVLNSNVYFCLYPHWKIIMFNKMWTEKKSFYEKNIKYLHLNWEIYSYFFALFCSPYFLAGIQFIYMETVFFSRNKKLVEVEIERHFKWYI